MVLAPLGQIVCTCADTLLVAWRSPSPQPSTLNLTDSKVFRAPTPPPPPPPPPPQPPTAALESSSSLYHLVSLLKVMVLLGTLKYSGLPYTSNPQKEAYRESPHIISNCQVPTLRESWRRRHRPEPSSTHRRPTASSYPQTALIPQPKTQNSKP